MTACSNHSETSSPSHSATNVEELPVIAEEPASIVEEPPTPPSDSCQSNMREETCDLDKIQDHIDCKLQKIKGNPLTQNIYATGQSPDAVIVYLSINNKYWRDEFRRLISDSPYIKFEGNSETTEVDIKTQQLYTGDSISLTTDRNVYPTDTKELTFTLKNNSRREIIFGEDYIVAYSGDNGKWYRLANPGIYNDIGHGLVGGGSKAFTAPLHPALNHNRPGLYRIYKNFRFIDEKTYRWVITEFRLTAAG